MTNLMTVSAEGLDRRWRRGALLTSGFALVGFALAAVAVIAGPGALMSIDGAILDGMIAARLPALTVLARAMTALGSGPVLILIAVLIAGVLWWRTRRLLSPAALLVTLAGSAALVDLLKITFGRARPPADLVLGVPALSDAFPSGHTTNGTVVFMLGAILLARTVSGTAARRIVITTAATIALLIGASRMYLGYHWFSDVAAGWLLATTITGLALLVLTIWPVPMTVPAGDLAGTIDPALEPAPRQVRAGADSELG